MSILQHRYVRWGLIAMLGMALVYVVGFYFVVLLIRSDSAESRLLGLEINGMLYRPVIRATPDDSFVRRAAVARFEWLCRGYERVCRVEAASAPKSN